MKKRTIIFILLVTAIIVSCENKKGTHNLTPEKSESIMDIVTTPAPPDVCRLRKAIRDKGDSLALEAYMGYYITYHQTDNDSILYYSWFMINKHSYYRAYYIMFNYWVNKYNEEKEKTRVADSSFIDSAMTCLVMGAQKGVKSCNVLLADLYANGIYFDRDTLLANDCYIKSGYDYASDLRKLSESYYRRKNLEIFLNDHWTTKPQKTE